MNTDTFTTVLDVTALLISLVAFVLSLYFVWRRALAERAMVRAFSALLQRHESYGRAREKVETSARQPDGDTEAILGLAEEAIERLTERDRALVLRALKQPSEQGREAYVRKLVREAQIARAS